MSEIDTRPPESVRNAAKRGLALRREFGRGGTAVGIARARDLARGARLSASTIKRMVSFFARHGSYAKDPDPSAPSTGYIAWLLWGGDAGKRWAQSIAKRLERAEKTLTMTKAADGARLMLIITSNAYEDREGEIVTYRALKEDTDRRWRDGKFVDGDPVVFWHDDPVQHPERIIGDVVYANMHGPFLVEVAKERGTDFARKVWNFVEKGDRAWGASHGFHYRPDEKARGEYTFVRKFETSILPLSAAANGYTLAGVVMTTSEQNEREALLDEILGEGTAKMVNKKIAQRSKKLDGAGVRRKQYDEQKQPAEAMEEDVKALTPEQAVDEIMAIVNSDADESAKRQSLIDLLEMLMNDSTPEMAEDEQSEEVEDEAVKAFKAFADGLTETQAEQAAALAVIQKRLGQLPAIIKSLDTRFKAVERRLAMTPRAASRAVETELTDDELLERVKAQTKRIDPFWGVEVKE